MGRDVPLQDTLTPAGQAPTTIPAGGAKAPRFPPGYYVDEKHYPNDERFIAEHFWLMVDHESRIPKPGDYFVFEYGRGDSVIVAPRQGRRGEGATTTSAAIAGRACAGTTTSPSEPAPKASRDRSLSVMQLGPSGNTPVFRCPYHAWTYDLSGKLISAPNGHAGRLRPVAERAAPVPRADGRGVHLRQPRAPATRPTSTPSSRTGAAVCQGLRDGAD